MTLYDDISKARRVLNKLFFVWDEMPDNLPSRYDEPLTRIYNMMDDTSIFFTDEINIMDKDFTRNGE